MNKFSLWVFVILSGLLLHCTDKKQLYTSGRLEIEKLTNHSFIHRSFLKTESFGLVSCNGLIFLKENEAIVFDTPTNDFASTELINWIRSEYGATIKAVILRGNPYLSGHKSS